MGGVRNARRAQAKTKALPKSARSKLGHGEYHGAPTKQHHAHKDGKAHRHAGGRDKHEHETSAQRFARRYPNAQPFGHAAIDAGGPSYVRPVGDGPKGGQWWNQHPYLIVALAIIAALALIAVFTPTGEQAATGTPTVQPTAQSIVYPRATATPRPRATATATPVEATPCPAPTLPTCELPPTEQAIPGAAIPEPTGAGASVGGALVPDGLRCMEDEIIGFVGVDTLGCVHIEGRTVEPSNPDTY